MLASRFGRNAHSLYSRAPLTDDQLRRIAPSIFAEDAHSSRSERYTYIPTSMVLAGLRKEGFAPFMVCQTRVRDEGKRDHTKHMLRLRHASQVNDSEAFEVIMVNAHDGTAAYQMLAGCFRFVCSNGLVVGDTQNDIRIPHKGKIVDEVIQGAYTVLNGAGLVREIRDDMRATALNAGEEQAFARAALALKYEPSETKPAPITETQLLRPRRVDDQGADLWSVFNRTQENLLRGGLAARTTAGRRTTTREVQGIDQNVKLNRALWVLAEEMRSLKATA